MKKSVFKALLPTLAMILVAVMALTGTTYAWFTNVTEATVDTLEIKVTSAANLKVAVFGTNITSASWTNNLSWTAINNATGTVKPTSKDDFKAVSTNGVLSSGVLNFFTADLNTAGTKITNIQPASTEYYKFDLYIWNDSDVQKTITLSGSVLENSGSIKVDTAMRLATVAATTKVDYTQGATIATAIANDGTAATIWEIDGTDHAYSATGAQDTYGITKVGTGEYDINADTEVTDKVTGMVSDPKNCSITIPAYSVGKMTVYIWLEGQDIDCINAITKGYFKANIQISAQ